MELMAFNGTAIEIHGFKRTAGGLIPVDWQEFTIGDLIRFEGGSQPEKSHFRTTPQPGYVRMIQIRDYKSDRFEVYVPQGLARRFCSETDIMIGRYGPPVFQILRGLGGAYNVALIKAIPQPEIDPTYAFYFLKNEQLFSFVEKLSRRSSGQTGVDLGELRAYPLPLPSQRQEQIAIARALATADALIGSLEELLTKKRQIKQGAMQELLTGKRRLPGFVHPWQNQRLDEVADPVVRINRDAAQLPVITCSKHLGFVDSLGFFKNQVFSNNTTTYKIVLRGQIAYPANHIEEGSIGYQDLYDAALVSPIYVVFQPRAGINGKFLHRLLKLPQFLPIFGRYTSSSVDRRGSLRWPAFSAIEVTLPTEEEQLAVVQVIETLEAEVAEQEAQLAKARALKQAMAQALLTGRIRLVEPNA